MDLTQAIAFFKLPPPTQIHQLKGGANNRVYKLEFGDQEPLVLKQYFQHSNDPRPRLKTEFSFLQYAWASGIRNIPKPLFYSSDLNAALYSFLPGCEVKPDDVLDEAIQQMTSFFLMLNRKKTEGSHLPAASEACFSIDDFINITEKRVENLKGIVPETPIEKEVTSFLLHGLFPKWTLLKEKACKAALHFKFPSQNSLALENRCITPSDFGFHNALIDESKKLFFFDFEYAGWDDPCKTICDLFCQPRIPIPERYFNPISVAVSSVTSDPETCLRRIQVVFPIIQMKWCCIILNSFTHVGKNRRMFSHSEEVVYQEKQLRQAKELLHKIVI